MSLERKGITSKTYFSPLLPAEVNANGASPSPVLPVPSHEHATRLQASQSSRS